MQRALVDFVVYQPFTCVFKISYKILKNDLIAAEYC